VEVVLLGLKRDGIVYSAGEGDFFTFGSKTLLTRLAY
jgi:hypothetical protein